MKFIFGKLQLCKGTFIRTNKTLFGTRHLFLVEVTVTDMDTGSEYKRSQVIKVRSSGIIEKWK